MGGKQSRMAHRKGRKTNKQDRVLADMEDGTADTLWRVQTNEQPVDGQQGGCDDQQDGVVERRAEKEDDRLSGIVDKQGGMTADVRADVTNKKHGMTDVDVHEKNGVTDKQCTITDTQSAGTDTPDPIMLGMIITVWPSQSAGQSFEARKDSRGSASEGGAAAQGSGLDIDCSKPLSDALENLVQCNKYNIIITSNSISQIGRDYHYIKRLIQGNGCGDAEIDQPELVEVQVQSSTYKIQIMKLMITNGCEVLDIGKKTLLHQDFSSILTIKDHEGIYKLYTPGVDSIDDQSVFIKVNFVKPSYDASKQLTILINWHTKLPLAKGEGSNRVTGEGSNRVIGDILETSFPPPNGASDLEAVDDTDQDTSTSPFNWLTKVLGRLQQPVSTGSIRQIFEEEDAMLVTFKLIHDDTDARICREPNTDHAIFGENGIKFTVNDYTGSI